MGPYQARATAGAMTFEVYSGAGVDIDGFPTLAAAKEAAAVLNRMCTGKKQSAA